MFNSIFKLLLCFSIEFWEQWTQPTILMGRKQQQTQKLQRVHLVLQGEGLHFWWYRWHRGGGKGGDRGGGSEDRRRTGSGGMPNVIQLLRDRINFSTRIRRFDLLLLSVRMFWKTWSPSQSKYRQGSLLLCLQNQSTFAHPVGVGDLHKTWYLGFLCSKQKCIHIDQVGNIALPVQCKPFPLSEEDNLIAHDSKSERKKVHSIKATNTIRSRKNTFLAHTATQSK